MRDLIRYYQSEYNSLSSRFASLLISLDLTLSDIQPSFPSKPFPSIPNFPPDSPSSKNSFSSSIPIYRAPPNTKPLMIYSSPSSRPKRSRQKPKHALDSLRDEIKEMLSSIHKSRK